jgi:hypothetical protein
MGSEAAELIGTMWQHMSASPPKADKQQTSREVRFVPEAAVSNRSKKARLFDHLVGGRDKIGRKRKPKRVGGPEIDDEIELR